MSNFTVGDVARISLEVFDVAGVLADPSSIELLIKPPNAPAVIHSSDVVKDATGKYHFDLPLNIQGSYNYRWQTFGVNQGVDEGGIFVYPQRVV